jgi:acetylornithine deacetylase/succinyl-diaminopimelate desuccinylase-like protein
METLLKVKKIFPKPVDKWIPTASVTVVEAGKEENTIPGQARAVINIRLTGGEQWSKAVVLEKIAKLLPPEVEIVSSSYGEVFEVDERNEYIKLLRKSAQEVLGKKMSYGENHGSSDAKMFMEQGIPLAILGPVGRYHHSPNEVLETESLLTHFEVLKRFIEREDEYRHKSIG